jgi:hypothetical protein
LAPDSSILQQQFPLRRLLISNIKNGFQLAAEENAIIFPDRSIHLHRYFGAIFVDLPL